MTRRPEEELTGLGAVALLEIASREIDELWRTAASIGWGCEAVALNEASRAVHCALIALQYGANARPDLFPEKDLLPPGHG